MLVWPTHPLRISSVVGFFISTKSSSFGTSHGYRLEVTNMTAEEARRIDKLRNDGVSYGNIAKLLHLKESTIKAYIRRKKQSSDVQASMNTCLECGKTIANGKYRPKRFCSDKCRMRWWNTHADTVNHKNAQMIVCPACGNEFCNNGRNKRKYCSHRCYIAARYYGGVCHE